MIRRVLNVSMMAREYATELDTFDKSGHQCTLEQMVVWQEACTFNATEERMKLEEKMEDKETKPTRKEMVALFKMKSNKLKK